MPPAPPLDEKAFAVVVRFIKLLLAKIIARFEEIDPYCIVDHAFVAAEYLGSAPFLRGHRLPVNARDSNLLLLRMLLSLLLQKMWCSRNFSRG